MILLLLLLACTPRPAEPAAPPPEAPVSDSAAPDVRPEHPTGVVEFVQLDGTVTTTPVGELPESRVWKRVDEAWVPVVRNVAAGVDGRVLSITSYGPDGQVLERTSAPR